MADDVDTDDLSKEVKHPERVTEEQHKRHRDREVERVFDEEERPDAKGDAHNSEEKDEKSQRLLGRLGMKLKGGSSGEKDSAPSAGDKSSKKDDEGRPARPVPSTGWAVKGDASTAEAKPQGDEAGNGASTQRRRRRSLEAETEEVTSLSRHKEEADEVKDLAAIPDLEEELQDDITTQVAAAPRNTGRKLPSLNELNLEIKYTLPSSTHSGIDLSLLTSALVPPTMLDEDDGPWEVETLMARVSAELQTEFEDAAAADASAALVKVRGG